MVRTGTEEQGTLIYKRKNPQDKVVEFTPADERTQDEIVSARGFTEIKDKDGIGYTEISGGKFVKMGDDIKQKDILNWKEYFKMLDTEEKSDIQAFGIWQQFKKRFINKEADNNGDMRYNGEAEWETRDEKETKRKIICNHPLEWDKEQYLDNNGRIIEEVKPLFGLTGDDADKVRHFEDEVKATDIWEGLKGKGGLPARNSFWFAHPAYFINHLDKVGLLKEGFGRIADPYRDWTQQDEDRGGVIQLGTAKGKENTLQQSGCKVTGAAKIISTITGEKLTPAVLASMADANGNLSRDAVVNKIKEYGIIVGGETITDITEIKLFEIENMKTFVLAHANLGGKKGGPHWVVVEKYSVDENKIITYDAVKSSDNDDGRIFSSLKENKEDAKTACVDRIETYILP